MLKHLKDKAFKETANPTPTSTQTEEDNIDEFIRYYSGHLY